MQTFDHINHEIFLKAITGLSYFIMKRFIDGLWFYVSENPIRNGQQSKKRE